MNDCDPHTEYRCSDGHCIHKVFYMDSMPDCADNSDGVEGPDDYCHLTLSNPICEDQSCEPFMFSCGDGSCSDGPDFEHNGSCRSHRDRLYLQ